MIFTIYCSEDFNSKYNMTSILTASNRSLIFYSKDYLNEIDSIPGESSDEWYDIEELLTSKKIKPRTDSLYIWFENQSFVNLDPRNWSNDEKALFYLTWS